MSIGCEGRNQSNTRGRKWGTRIWRMARSLYMKENFQQILSFTLYRAVFCDLLPEKFCLKIPKESSKAVTRRKTDKYLSSKYYTENKRLSNSNSTPSMGWSQMVRKGEQCLLYKWHQSRKTVYFIDSFTFRNQKYNSVICLPTCWFHQTFNKHSAYFHLRTIRQKINVLNLFP